MYPAEEPLSLSRDLKCLRRITRPKSGLVAVVSGQVFQRIALAPTWRIPSHWKPATKETSVTECENRDISIGTKFIASSRTGWFAVT